MNVAELNQLLIETIVEIDEDVLARYFDGQPPTAEETNRLIVQAVAQGNLIPIVCVASKHGGGLKELLETLAMCGLSPDKIVRKATNDAGQEVEVKCDPAGPLVAQVWRTRIDPFVQKLSFLRIYSGTLKKDESVHVSGLKKNLKIGPLLEVQGSETKAIESASVGEIVAISKTEDLHTGATLGSLKMPPIKFPRPMVGLAAMPKTRGDEAKLSGRCTKSWRKTPPSASIAIRKPKSS